MNNTEQQKREALLYQHIPQEYVVSVQHWQLDDFLTMLQAKHQLYFNKTAYHPFNHLAWWQANTKVYHTSLNHYWEFSQMDFTPKIALQRGIPGNLFIAFTLNSYPYDDHLLVVEVTPEVFFDLGLIYLEGFSKDFDRDSVFIFNQDVSKWMIPSNHLLSQLVTNFAFMPDSFAFEQKPWQSYFINLEAPFIKKLSYDLFESFAIYQNTQELEETLSNIQEYLYQYYRLSIQARNSQPHTPETLFEVLKTLVNNTTYDDLKFEGFYGKTHSLAYIIRRTVDIWQTMYEDAFSDSSDPDNVFSLDAEDCWFSMRKVKA